MLVSIISDDDPIASDVRKLLIAESLDCPLSHVVSLELAADHVTKSQPDLVAVVLGRNHERALGVMLNLRGKAPGRVIAVGPAEDPKLVIRALRSGADDYVDVMDLDIHMREALLKCPDLNRHQLEAGKVIAVLAPSGGSGSSTLAVNVATALAKQHNESVLIDMKLEAGDLSALLHLKPTYTISDLCQNLSRLDQTFFERTLTRHSSGVHLLAPPQKRGESRHVTPESISRVLNLARYGFPYVVVDLDHSYREEQTQVLREADTVLLVVRLDFTALRNARRTLDYFEELGLDRARVRLVINRYGQPKEVPYASAEEALGCKIFHFVPDEPKTVNRANNNGVPMVIESPSAKVSKSLIKLAAGVNGNHKPH